MDTPDTLWEVLGEVPEEELLQVLTKLFFAYEEDFRKNPSNPETLNFFRRLGLAIEQTSQCNLNRR